MQQQQLLQWDESTWMKPSTAHLKHHEFLFVCKVIWIWNDMRRFIGHASRRLLNCLPQSLDPFDTHFELWPFSTAFHGSSLRIQVELLSSRHNKQRHHFSQRHFHSWWSAIRLRVKHSYSCWANKIKYCFPLETRRFCWSNSSSYAAHVLAKRLRNQDLSI